MTRNVNGFALTLGVIVLLANSPAEASGGERLRDQLALELAVVGAHEGAFENRNNVALVWQVTENRAATTQGRLEFLRSHSGRALGRKPCTDQNCVWSVELLHAPNRPPSSIDADWWMKKRDHLWRETVRYALGLVYGIETWRPCTSPPYSWGYVGDYSGALDRGLRPLGCEGLDQDGFALAPRTVLAAVAKGGRR